ncbi:MAG: hypothetical protein GBAus27B_000322 [Mycoplasmataceae bacterium]|nr:MAG: hypothetical protein GBAus27B_000322 [Mycoplasmataceae bacterium]
MKEIFGEENFIVDENGKTKFKKEPKIFKLNSPESKVLSQEELDKALEKLEKKINERPKNITL